MGVQADSVRPKGRIQGMSMLLPLVAALVVLAETVTCFQAPWLPCPVSSGSGLRAPASFRRAAPRMQGMGFDDGSGTVSRGDVKGKKEGGEGRNMQTGMPPGMEKLFSDPEILEALKNPKLVKVSLSAVTLRERTRARARERERAINRIGCL